MRPARRQEIECGIVAIGHGSLLPFRSFTKAAGRAT
jgi:hypothetical protein